MSVALVDDAGKVTAIGNGETDITATSEEGGFIATCKVTVSQVAGTQVYVKTPDGFFLNGETYFAAESGSQMAKSYVFKNGIKLYTFDGSILYKMEVVN